MKEWILYEDNALLVVRKPAGIAVESADVTQADLYSRLRLYLDGGEVFIVHRLDQPVEGLLVFAKTKMAAAALSKQLTDGRMTKLYTARVCGAIPKEEDTLVDYLVWDRRTNVTRVAGKTGERAVKRGRDEPKRAVLHYRRTGEDVLLVRLETGRHHQIRAQLSHAGMPIRGDRKYGGGAWRRLCLCASALEFQHPGSGRHMAFSIEPNFDLG